MKRKLLASLLPTILFTASASAFRQPEYLQERPLETAGARARAVRYASYQTPARASASLDAFRARHGSWRALWDRDTGVPTRLWGEGIDAPGAVADAAIAEARAREILERHLDLLAPGAAASDFAASRNLLRQGVRTVAFRQSWNGMEVVGADLLFTFKHDRLIVIGSTATPSIAIANPSARVAKAAAQRSARAWVEQAFGAGAVAGEPEAAKVLPIVDELGRLSHHVVTPVGVGLGRGLDWTVYVDAATGDPVARQSRVFFGAGTVQYRVPERHPDGGYQGYPAAYLTHQVDGSPVTSSSTGGVSWAGGAAGALQPGLSGTYQSINVAQGPSATDSLSLPDAGSVLWDHSTTELLDAQLSAAIHATIAKRYAIETLDADLPWLHGVMPVTVNHTQATGGYQCNAFSNLDDIHFFIADEIPDFNFRCGNTARISDVVYHEFGHSLHAQSSGLMFEIDSALSEGTSDYYAATIVNDAAMGPGFDLDNPEYLRHLDPVGDEAVWPDDISNFDTHVTGLIIGGALWDLRKALIEELGAEAGVALADDIYYGIIVRASDIPSSYTEALVTDDDDGNLANGTPHKCIIDGAFGAHGLAEGGLAVAPPTLDGLTVTVPQLAQSGGACPGPQIESVTVDWRVRGGGEEGTFELTESGGAFTGDLPAQPDDTVLQYQVLVALDSGATRQFPQNDAAPLYETYVGPVTEIECFDFESGAAGWSLSNFEVGTPAPPTGSDDPDQAFAGSGVLATNLAGPYQWDATSRATSPEIDVSGYEVVRLQYRRWLNSEDAIYDPASIVVDGAQVWSSVAGGGGTHHTDREWRFHDVDLTAQAADGTVEVSFQLTADGFFELGGWTVDEVCIVAAGAAAPACGDGSVDTGEDCDDGNDVDGDGCSATCADEDTDEGGCCSAGNGGVAGPLMLGLATFGLAFRRRRRRWPSGGSGQVQGTRIG